MRLSGSDILVKSLIEQGCDTVFGYPGGQILEVYDSLYKYKEEIRHVLTAHEQGAAHAADGYARSTGRVGVVISTSGPGATNLVTGIATAYMDSVPMVAICGNVPTAQIGTDSFQEIDITGITLPITKHNYFVTDVNTLADTVREAFSLAVSGRPGPVLIDIPKDVQQAVAEYSSAVSFQKATPFSAKDIRIAAAAECINKSKRPYIYFGGGVLASGATEEMLSLAEKIDAPMGCSMMGISIVSTDHPRFLGMQGIHGSIVASMAMDRADCIISLGVRFSDRAMGNREGFDKNASIVHIDIDGSELSKTVLSNHGLRGDIKETLIKLLPLLKDKKLDSWSSTVADLKKEHSVKPDHGKEFTPYNIMSTVSTVLCADMAVATDVGQHQLWAAQYLSFKTQRRFLTSGGLGTMGYGMGAAIGAAFGTGSPSILITGDGSFGMNLNELATVASYNVPVIIIIFNNSALGMIRQWQTMFYGNRYFCSDLDRKTDFVKLGQAFGVEGASVSTLDEFDSVLKNAAEAKKPFIIECKIDKAMQVDTVYSSSNQAFSDTYKGGTKL